MFSKICENTRLKDTINFKKTEQINSESPKIECKCLNIDNYKQSNWPTPLLRSQSNFTCSYNFFLVRPKHRSMEVKYQKNYEKIRS